MDRKNIRNFCIIAHIDHGKSTLADRFLEITGTVNSRNMKDQYLDSLELERERGITIKMAPVQMIYKDSNCSYTLNLIDTPGHSDFSYEVSRALAAVEGGVLLVDGKQGIQAQTLSNFRNAKKAGLKIIGVINKIDIVDDRSELNDLIIELADMLEVSPDEIHLISAKTGEGISNLLKDIVNKVPPPGGGSNNGSRALIFDSFYDNHKGVVMSVRVFNGEFDNKSKAFFLIAGSDFQIKELGYFVPSMKSVEKLEIGQIGYIATGVKDPNKIKIGDTISNNKKQKLLPGYKEPKSSVFVSFYPDENDGYNDLDQALERLRLNDSALTISGDRNEVLGRGFKVGFLGKLHYEITSERLRQEFGIDTIHTFPSVKYKIRINEKWKEITQPEDAPDYFDEIKEPIINIKVLLPSKFLSNLVSVQYKFRMEDIKTRTEGKNILVEALMPLSELVADFDDVLKSITEGYGSFSYVRAGYKTTDVVRVDFLVSGKKVPGISRFFPKDDAIREGRKMVKRLKEHLPKQQYAQPVQAAIGSNIIAREDIKAMKKDVTGYLYGGDITRKQKLWQKQKRGKKRLKKRSEAILNEDIFKELLKK